MANVGIGRNDVFEAANELALLGVEPTIKAIREKLGNTGSLTTISKYRDEWYKWKEAQTPTAAIPENFTLAAQNLWSIAFREAETVFHSQKEALNNEKQKWIEEKSIYNSELEKFELEKIAKDKKIRELELNLDDEVSKLTTLKESQLELSEKLAKLEGELLATKDRLTSESERNQRLEKQLFDLIKANK